VFSDGNGKSGSFTLGLELECLIYAIELSLVMYREKFEEDL